MGRVPLPLLALGALGAAAAVVGVAIAPGSAEAGSTVVLHDKDCTSTWASTRTGFQRFTLDNRSTDVSDVELVGSDRTTVYAQLDGLVPGTHEQVSAVIPPGTYTWKCQGESGTVLFSPAARVTGPAVVAHPLVPASLDDMQTAVNTYRVSVTAGLAQLVTDTDRLDQAVASGDVTAAKQRWLVAHLDYERLGAAYDTFGDFDDAINGSKGFHPLEAVLWRDGTTPDAKAIATGLAASTRALQRAFPNQLTLPTDVPLRTHEILENALQLELTGKTDEGSGTELATVRANVDGTVMTLKAITPILTVTAPTVLSTVSSGLQHEAALLDTFHHDDGSWTRLEDLTQAQREQVDAATSQLLEQLALIPDLIETSHTLSES